MRIGVIDGIGTTLTIIGITHGEEVSATLISMVITAMATTVFIVIRAITVTGILGIIPAITDFTTIMVAITDIMAIMDISLTTAFTTTGIIGGEDREGIMTSTMVI